MDLESFRSIVVDVDFATDYIPDIQLSGSDYQGRILVARVTDGGASVSGTGLGARLLFNTDPFSGNDPGGYVTMSAVAGADTATWQVPVPSDALRARTVLLCIQIIDSDENLVCSRNFRGRVDQPVVDDQATESVNELNRLFSAIENIAQYEQDASRAAVAAEQAVADAATARAATAEIESYATRLADYAYVATHVDANGNMTYSLEVAPEPDPEQQGD